jgi:hypothetical protein
MNELELRRVGLQLQAAHRFLQLANALTEVKHRHRRILRTIRVAAPWAVVALSAMLVVRVSRQLAAPRASGLTLRVRAAEAAIGLYLIARCARALQVAKPTIPNQLGPSGFAPHQLGPGRPS